jgi:hypothetical protein
MTGHRVTSRSEEDCDEADCVHTDGCVGGGASQGERRMILNEEGNGVVATSK